LIYKVSISISSQIDPYPLIIQWLPLSPAFLETGLPSASLEYAREHENQVDWFTGLDAVRSLGMPRRPNQAMLPSAKNEKTEIKPAKTKVANAFDRNTFRRESNLSSHRIGH
jgi:hypothetical protein